MYICIAFPLNYDQECLQSWNLLKQNMRSLRNTRERASRQENGEQGGDKLETPILDRGGSKIASNSLNNGDKPEMTVIDQGDSKRAPNRWNNGDKPEKSSLISRRQLASYQDSLLTRGRKIEPDTKRKRMR